VVIPLDLKGYSKKNSRITESHGGVRLEQVDVRTNLGRYDRILLLDPGIIPIKDEEILAFMIWFSVP
jgi:hypothetical protein